MKLIISPDLIYLDRAEWGADPAYPRQGYFVGKDRRTHAIMHHTVGVDNDPSPNLWESMEEIKSMMRRLQTIRPDLGLDVPYNDVSFLMAGGKLVVCEGRGQDRTGAHTHGHNTEGYALALAGNFELPRDIGPWIPTLSCFWGWLKYERGMVNLGTVRPPMGWVFGHQNFRDPSDRQTWTACPGTKVMARIEHITFMEEDMVSQAEFDKFCRDMEAVNAFQNELLVGLKAATDLLVDIAHDHEKRLKALKTHSHDRHGGGPLLTHLV